MYEPGAERDRILTAALEVLRRHNGEEATVADILQEAGLSTRAFYRHFETKEDVIRALYERDAKSFGRHLRSRVDAAGDPQEALEVWVNETLGLGYDRRRSERVSALGSPMVLRVMAGYPSASIGVDELVEPLREVLHAGRAAGVFPSALPDVDSFAIRALALEVVGWTRSGNPHLTRRQALELVLRFSRGALGAAP